MLRTIVNNAQRYHLKLIRTLSTQPMQASSVFRSSGAAEFLAAATTSKSVPKLEGLPEVIVAGRANAGKSTLLNAVLGRADLVHTSKKAGRTRALNFFRVGESPGNLVLVDSPGYGMRGRPEWGELWTDYIDTRKMLRQICILINSKHGVTAFDQAMLEDLHERLSKRSNQRFPPYIQPILTKIDTLEGDQKELSAAITAIFDDIIMFAPSSRPPILTAMSKLHNIGVEAVRESMANACGFKS